MVIDPNNRIRHKQEICIIARNPPQEKGTWQFEPWDAYTVGPWVETLEGASAVVNLAGRSVDCVKSPDNCDAILRSRVETTRLLGRALHRVKNPPAVWVQMSTAHIYGDSLDALCSEDSAYGYGLAPFVGQAWEEAFEASALPGMRKVILRTSFVLGRDRGALKRLVKVARLGLGGKVGHGKQGISWIHEADMNQLFWRAITQENMEGVYIATAPHPVSNAVFMRALRKALGMPIGLPAMGWMVKLGASLFLKTDPELALYGRYCVSQRLEKEGFTFAFPSLEAALQDLFKAPH